MTHPSDGSTDVHPAHTENSSSNDKSVAKGIVSRPKPIPAFPISIFVHEELIERSWSFVDAARQISTNEIDILWLQLICHTPAWYEGTIIFTQRDADKLAAIFGTSSELWLNHAKAFAESPLPQDYVIPDTVKSEAQS